MAMLQLLLLTLLGGHSALSSKVSSQNECAQGATYWCKNFVTALQCGAFNHCLQAGWSSATNEDMCADCKQVVTILIRMAKESSFQVIKKAREDECTTIRLQTLIPRCQELVDTYYALFLASLEAQLKPGTVCARFGFCQSDLLWSKETLDVQIPEAKALLQLLQGKPLARPNNRTQGDPREEFPFPIPLPTCWLCQTMIGRIESTIPTGAIGKSLAQVCRLMPGSISGMCQCLTEKYTTIIVDGIMSKLGPRLICGMMLMCATEEEDGPDTPVQADRCQTCLAISSQMKATLKANSSQAEMEAALLTACGRIDLDWQECEIFLSQYQPKLFTLLAKPWTAQTTCQEVGACATKLGPVPGVCARGPAYWCSSLSAAEQCKAVKHCQDHVWL
ncbi:pulmonary surfactant-associated protein B [Tiliqua scincoides]|uniref:pulmonary surfactant-associated protein B n=1 Tax=Tiliqua scincoides TaxID=71010 RepID=UPI00346293A7